MPLECLLADSDIELVFYYLSDGDPLNVPIPEHDVVLVAANEADENRHMLVALEKLLAAWPKPLVNRPQSILRSGRDMVSSLLQEVPGLFVPETLRASRTDSTTSLCDIPALEAIHQRIGLDYLCIDCAETRAGSLLIFELDHAMDSEAMFPYKPTHMLKVKNAFRDYLSRLTAAQQ